VSDVSAAAVTADDLDWLLPMHQQAFAGTMGASLGRAYLRRFLMAFLDRPDRIFLAARIDGEPVGYVFGRPTTAADDRHLLPWVAYGLLRHPRNLARSDIRAELVRRVRRLEDPGVETPGLPEPAVSLVGIGVDPERQGEGIGQRLIAAFEEAAADGGYAAARLSVYRDNAHARRLYEGCGWQPVDHPKPSLLSYTWTNPRSTPSP
jgi:ribosomal protein S18 acetylase RimI-like enzyme